MSELLKSRKQLTEPEARYYLTQVVAGLKYLHEQQIIHRDIKIGNLYLTSELCIKLGDLSDDDVGMISYEHGAQAGDNQMNFRANAITSFSLASSGYAGFNEMNPETAVEITNAAPYLTHHNSTHEDTDGSRESRFIFKGEQSGGEETAGFQFEASHDGSNDDQKFKGVWSVNTGSGLVEAMRLDSDGVLTTKSGQILKTSRYTSTQILGATDHQVFCNPSLGGAFTVSLPAGIVGTEYRIMNTGTTGKNVTIAPDGLELLIGVNSNFVLRDGEALQIVYENTEGWA